MFVKLRTFEDQQMKREAVYDCKRASIYPSVPQKPGTPSADVVLLIMDVGDQDERTVEIPFNTDGVETEVYYMNNAGKTIDRYQY